MAGIRIPDPDELGPDPEPLGSMRFELHLRRHEDEQRRPSVRDEDELPMTVWVDVEEPVGASRD